MDKRYSTKLKNVLPMQKIMYQIKPKRYENEVYINETFDVTNLVKYVKTKKKENSDLTFFHVFVTSIAKVIYNMPKLNRYIKLGELYQRNKVSIAFVAKTEYNDDAEEYMAMINIDNEDNLDTISNKIKSDVKKIRSSKKQGTDNVIETVASLPKFLRNIVISAVKFLDNHGKLPKSMVETNLYYSSVIVSNLGSIHCSSIYHNISEFGTNSILMTIGEIKEIDGKFYCDFGITLDERIGDGVYFVKTIPLLKKMFENPKLLEEEVQKIINIK